MACDAFPVAWTGQRAIVSFPGHVDVSNAGQLRDRLLSVINRGAVVVIADMTGTLSCDYSAADALVRAFQRAVVTGTQLRLVVTDAAVRRVLSNEGLDRLVSIYPALDAAIAAGGPAGGSDEPQVARPQADGMTRPGLTAPPGIRSISPAVLWQLLDALGDGLALTGEDGKIVMVNGRCAEMFGYQREELAGLPVDALVPPDLRAAHQGQRIGFSQAPRERPMRERARLVGLRKDGATIPVEISLSPVPTATERYVLAVIRDAAGARRRDDLADLARSMLADQSHLADELLDRVAHRLFQVGLSLQAATDLPAHVARERLAEALDQLDLTIQEIRDYAFAVKPDHPDTPLRRRRDLSRPDEAGWRWDPGPAGGSRPLDAGGTRPIGARATRPIDAKHPPDRR